MEIVSQWQTIPNISFVNSFYNNEQMIMAFANHGHVYNPQLYDHVLFSFHGLPQRQLLKGDDTHSHCLKISGCCMQINNANKFCYSAQCCHTAQLIAAKLDIPAENYTVCFQSRLGKTPWIEPYTSDVIVQLAKEGKKRILVFCPAFVADCLETIYEIGGEYKEMFLQHGGEELQLVDSLNDDPLWISALHEIACQ
jgi:ferrochelatase